MDLGLKDKVAVVAASSRGLGRAVAEELAREGMSLVLCARGADALRQAAAEIRADTGARVVDVPADVGDPAGRARVMAAVAEQFGRVDVLVNNSGGPPAGPFEMHAAEAWSEAIRQNLDSVVELT